MEKLTAQELVQILFQQDKEIADENGCDVEKDGLKSYNGWIQASSNANDSQTREDLESVDRNEFAREWEALAWAQEDDDDDDDDNDNDDDDDNDESEKEKKDREWLEALNGRR